MRWETKFLSTRILISSIIERKKKIHAYNTLNTKLSHKLKLCLKINNLAQSFLGYILIEHI